MIIESEPEILQLSARPSNGNCEILVVSHLKAKKKNWDEYGEYRVTFEINQRHAFISQGVEFLVIPGKRGQPTWLRSSRRDLAPVVRDHFLTTPLYTEAALQLGWSA